MKHDLQVKYGWLKEKFNDVVELATSAQNLESFRAVDLDLHDFYAQLKRNRLMQKVIDHKMKPS